MKSKKLTRAISFVLLVSLLPLGAVLALTLSAAPPADMFQLPWDLGIAWYAIDGIDNTSKRPASSSHNYSVGGAIDFAPKVNMIKGEDTSNYWVTAAAAGTVTEMSSCYVVIDHGNGWSTHYYFLANVQVQVGNAVARNQRLGIIADGVRNKFCPGSEEPNIPHLHFMLRPTLIGATFAGWTVNYNWYYNFTTFTKNGKTVGLYKPLLNTMDDVITPTPTDVTPTPTEITPTPTGPYLSTSAEPLSIDIGGNALITVRLNNVPVEGYTSVEVTCPYNSSLLEAGNISVAGLFGTDPAVAINGPQNGSFIVAVAGSHGNNATTSGAVFTFNAKGMQAGETSLECTGRVNSGDNILTDLPSIGTNLSIMGAFPTPTATQSPEPPTATPTPIVSPSPAACDRVELIGDVSLPGGTVVLPGQLLSKTWRVKNIGTCTWTPSYGWFFVSGVLMNATPSNTFADNVLPGQEADVYVSFVAPSVEGHYQSFWKLHNDLGVQFGTGDSAITPLLLDIVVSGPTVTPVTDLTASPSPMPTSTVPAGDWLTFTNQTYGFRFQYPPQGVVASGGDDNFTRIDLPFVQGTNLREKYLEMVVVENANPCQSPLATQSILDTSEIVTINGLSFLKQTGGDGAAGNLYQWVAYSTFKDNVCVSLDFILHSLNPGNFPTPPPVFDFAAESEVFGQMVSTYAWLPAVQDGTLLGTVIASKPVTVNLYDLDDVLVETASVNLDGTFTFTLPAGTYTAVASSSGFLNAQASVTITGSDTTTLTTIRLPAGDIDGNGIIDQFDALTIGMNYNAAEPSVADLNNDGIINVLDLEALAGNYRKVSPVVWQ